MIERTLVLVKPDGVERALVGKVISRLEEAGLKVVAMKMLLSTKELAGKHYYAEQKWFEDTGNRSIKALAARGVVVKDTPVQFATRIRNYLIEFLTDAPIVAMVLEGNEAISITRKIVGSTEPKNSDPSTIRGMYSLDSYERADQRKGPIRNIIHASEDKRTADREIKVWFKPKEILDYKRADQDAIY